MASKKTPSARESELPSTGYRYDASKNPTGAHLPGVPLRDLAADEVAAFSPLTQRSIAAQPFYSPAKVEVAPESTAFVPPVAAEAAPDQEA